MSESVVATTYPEKWEYEAWKKKAEKMEMSVSEYIQAMTRAGQKKFSVPTTPGSKLQELRDSRGFYQDEGKRLQRRIKELETKE